MFNFNEVTHQYFIVRNFLYLIKKKMFWPNENKPYKLQNHSFTFKPIREFRMNASLNIPGKEPLPGEEKEPQLLPCTYGEKRIIL